MNEDDDRKYYQCIKLTYYYCTIYTFFVFFICFISAPVAIALYAAMFGVFAFPKEFARRLYKIKTARESKIARSK